MTPEEIDMILVRDQEIAELKAEVISLKDEIIFRKYEILNQFESDHPVIFFFVRLLKVLKIKK